MSKMMTRDEIEERIAGFFNRVLAEEDPQKRNDFFTAAVLERKEQLRKEALGFVLEDILRQMKRHNRLAKKGE